MVGETFKERPPEERAAPVRVPLPVAREMHTPIDVLSRSVAHLRTHSEATYRDTGEADFRLSVAKNIQELRLEGSAPLSSRFARLLDALS